MTSSAAVDPLDAILSEELLERIRMRAPGYDRDNAFFAEDLAELRDAGYLALMVPVDQGGSGFGLADTARAQLRLAAAAPATALGVNMHLVWTAVARILHDRGDTSLDGVLREAAEGEVHAFGISEAGNDSVLFDSGTRAEPDGEGGYRFTGTKVYTSLSPAWTRLGTFGRDDTDPDAPCLVHGFVRREDGGFRISDDWDPLGMRATQSRSTHLEGTRVPAERITRILPVGPSADPLVFGIFAAFELLIASVYTGLARRALELAIDAVQRSSSRASGLPRWQDPDVRRRVADAAIALDALEPQILGGARDVDELVDRGAGWFPTLVGTKIRATETAIEVVDQAVRIVGGAAYGNASELARLSRDVGAGLFHPSNLASAQRTFATRYLGPLPQ